MTTPGQVFIIGAGPGEPGLISARGRQRLSEADVVVYDRDVEALLRWAHPNAERIAAGAPAERATAQDAISMLLAEKARDGHVVARLKWGDAFVFDSGGKEAMFLHEQGIRFEVVPGIPLAIGASAYAGVPLTYPGSGDTLLMVRGFEDGVDTPPDVDWAAAARLDGTLVCYAGGRQVSRVLSELMANGLPADRPAVCISAGTLPSQGTVTGTVGELAAATSTEPVAAPVMLIVGEVVALRDHLRWFDDRPLFGKRVVVTRSPEQAPTVVDELERLGAQTIVAPTFRVTPPEDPEAIDRAAASVEQYQWVVFESANSVARLLAALGRGPRDFRALGSLAMCAIGASTAEQLAAHGFRADVVIAEHGDETVGALMDAHATVTGSRVLVVRPDHHRDVVTEELKRRGAAVTDLVAYRTSPAAQDSAVAQGIYRMLLDGQVDAVTFTSPTAVNRFCELIGREQAADLLNTTVVATIGPVTAAAARAQGITPTVVAAAFTVPGMLRALVDHFGQAGGDDRQAARPAS